MCTLRAAATTVTVLIGFGLSGASPHAQDKEQIERGIKLYAVHKCDQCHSIQGRGAKKGPLDGVGSKLSEEEIRLWLVDASGMTKKTKSTRKPFMKNMKAPPEDIEALVAYMKTLK